MGVYIKGMEMPTSCWDCEVGGAKQMDNATCPFYSMEYWEQENYQDKIADGCPLVPVPEHGRLIDADGEISVNVTMMPGGKCRIGLIAPTIIPADKEVEG